MVISLLLLAVLNTFQSSVHPIHISRSEVNYDTDSRSLQITLHVFIDDLEDAMVLSNLPNPKIGAKSELKNSDQLIFDYVKEKLLFYNTTNEILKLNWIGKEQGDSPLALICYLEIENVRTSKGLSVKNDVIMDLHDDQVNIVETFVDNRPKHAFHLKKKGFVRALEF
jgi:hypothetical protein